MLNAILENRLIEALTGRFARSPQQLNSRHETDAEIIRLSGSCTLAITTDSIAEEIACGLYSDPYLVGWMTVMANLSDIAAVGAEPVGMVISEVLAESCTEDFVTRMNEGIQDACRACGIFVLGGDINTGRELVLTGTAIGICPNAEFLSRSGCKPGDLVCVTDRVGTGNAFALLALFPELFSNGSHSTQTTSLNYLPVARLKQGQALRGTATSCMDTSDGVIATLDQLMRLNRVGFALGPDWVDSLDPWARGIARESEIPEFLLLAGQHGEFELLFTIPPDKLAGLNAHVLANRSQPIVLGKVISEPAVTLNVDGESIRLDTARIRNLAIEKKNDPMSYLHKILNLEREMLKGVAHHASI